MILLVSYGGGHITIISRVYKYFISNGIEARIIPLTTAVSFCDSQSIDYLKIEDFFNIEDLDFKIKAKIIEVAKDNHNEKMNIPFSHTLAYYGIGLNQLFLEKGYKAGLEHYNKNGRKSFLPLNFAKKVITALKPKAIITTNVPRMELAFRKVGRSLNVKTYAIDDLIGYFRGIENIHSDVIFVDNNKALERLKNYGYLGEIIISGNPVYEDIYKLRENYSRERNKNLLVILQSGISNMKTTVVTEFSESFFKTFFRNLEELSFFNSFDKVSVRFHPSMTKKKYWKTDNIEIDDVKNIHQSLLNNSNVLGLTSTAIYEAFLIGCNVFNLSFQESFFKLPIEYIGDIDMEGNIKFYKENPEPVFQEEISSKKSLQIIYNKVINEVFKN